MENEAPMGNWKAMKAPYHESVVNARNNESGYSGHLELQCWKNNQLRFNTCKCSDKVQREWLLDWHQNILKKTFSIPKQTVEHTTSYTGFCWEISSYH